jgi:hypothetical protein
VTIRASSNTAVEPDMAERLRLLARLIATAHRRRLAEAEATGHAPRAVAAKKQNGEAKL